MGPSVLPLSPYFVLLVFLNDDRKTLKESFSWMEIKTHSYCDVQADQHQYLSRNLHEVTQAHVYSPMSCGESLSETSAFPFISNSLFSQCLSQSQCPSLLADERAATVSSMWLPHKQYQVPFLNCLAGIKPTRSSFINFPIALFSLFVIISVNI